MLTTLKEKVDPKHVALIVVDVQNDFCANGGAMQKAGYDVSLAQEMVPRLTKFITEARKAKLPIVYIQGVYDLEYLSDVQIEQAKRRKEKMGVDQATYVDIPVCIKGSWGWEFYDGIKPKRGEIVVTKHRFSAFINTDLDLLLRSKKVKTLIMTGVNTNVCVESTTRDAFFLDYYIVFVKDCIAGYSKALHESTLENVELFYGQVVSSKDVTRCWEQLGC